MTLALIAAVAVAFVLLLVITAHMETAMSDLLDAIRQVHAAVDAERAARAAEVAAAVTAARKAWDADSAAEHAAAMAELDAIHRALTEPSAPPPFTPSGN